jgi:mRNA-degrading endonuclease RelE of RelBE toxin-antitoxin system
MAPCNMALELTALDHSTPMAYITPIFTKELRGILSDDEYRSVQAAIMLRPEQGATIRGTGGIRKLRWSGKGHSKSGGLRLIYYWDKKLETIYMLYVYAKSRQEDLTAEQCRLLGRLVREKFK